MEEKMKKTGFIIVLLLLGFTLFAEDAKVLPARVGRVYLAPAYSFATGAFDDEGNHKKFSDGSFRLINLGFAMEYGVLNWITAALQWAPGWTPWSNISAATGANNTNMNGFADIFAGAKIQLIGQQAPFKKENIRLALAPGVIIPLPGPDFGKELGNAMGGRKATLASMDNHTFGIGARTYFDLVFNKNFFVNLYNETIFYPLKKDIKKVVPITGISGEVNFKFRTAFEVEPVYSTAIGDGINFGAGLPLTYKYSPAPGYSSVPFSYTNSLNSKPQHSLAVTPNVSVFFSNFPLPMEFKFQYGIPLWGRNTVARQTATLQVRMYLALPGGK